MRPLTVVLGILGVWLIVGLTPPAADGRANVLTTVGDQRPDERRPLRWINPRLLRQRAVTVRVGESLLLRAPPKHVLLRVDIDPTPEVGADAQPAPGSRFIAVFVSVENVAGRVAEVAPASSLAVVDAADRQGIPSSHSCGPKLDRVRLRPGRRRAGCVLFETASDTAVTRIQYRLEGSDAGGGALAEWDVPDESRRAGGMSSVARRYPRRIRRTFMAECNRSSRGRTAICACSLRRIERQYSFRAFMRIDRGLRRGTRRRLPRKVVRIVARCVRERG